MGGWSAGSLSGLVVPPAWFPAWAQAVLAWTPFPALMQIPIDVFIEQGSVGPALASQLFWAVLLLALGRVVLRRGSTKLVVQGG